MFFFCDYNMTTEILMRNEITFACAVCDCPPSSSHVHRNLQARHVKDASTSHGATV